MQRKKIYWTILELTAGQNGDLKGDLLVLPTKPLLPGHSRRQGVGTRDGAKPITGVSRGRSLLTS